MKTFYRLTGVQPYLYIADGVNGSNQPSSSEIESYAASLYDQLFTDEAHFLLVFCDDGMGSYICGYQTGSAGQDGDGRRGGRHPGGLPRPVLQQ